MPLGVSRAALLSGNKVIVVTEGSQFSTTYGYQSSSFGNYGSISPTKLLAVNIEAIFFHNTNSEFYIYLAGNLPQDFFQTINPESGNILRAANATFSYDSPNDVSVWKWTSQTKPSQWDGSGTSKVWIQI